jgi:cysteine synthase A
LAGVSLALKERNSNVRIVLADPEGSGLFGWVKSNDLTIEGSSITEGMGPSRVPENLAGVAIEDAERIPEAPEQIYDVLIHEGLSVGTSAGINIGAAIRVARAIGLGAHGRNDPVRRRVAVSIDTFQSGVPARQRPAGAALAGPGRCAVGPD